jgi:hypothetical protein
MGTCQLKLLWTLGAHGKILIKLCRSFLIFLMKVHALSASLQCYGIIFLVKMIFFSFAQYLVKGKFDALF